MKIKAIESVTETEMRLTLSAESAEEIALLKDMATYPRLSGVAVSQVPVTFVASMEIQPETAAAL